MAGWSGPVIVDLDDLPHGSLLQADVCIVGGGIAGLLLAHALLDSQSQILLLESGGLGDEQATQALTDAEISGWPYKATRDGRFRVLGGSSTRWGGQLLPLTPNDFARRPHVPGSGWPIDGTALEPYLQRIEALMGVNHLPYDDRLNTVLQHAAPPLPESSAWQLRYSKWAPFSKRNLAQSLGAGLARHPRVRVVLHANVTSLDRDDLGQITALQARSLGGRCCTAEARQLVLCCGTVETVRLLLATATTDRQAIGNHSGLLGRYFHDHLSLPITQMSGAARAFALRSFAPWYRGGTRHSLKLETNSQWQRRQGCLGTMAHLVFSSPEGSAIAWARQHLQGRQCPQPGPAPSVPWRSLLRDGADLLELSLRRAVQRRRWSPRAADVHLTIDCEQAPSHLSCITLSDRCNSLGEPLAKVSWHWGEHEHHTIEQVAALLDRQWRRWGLGRLSLPPNWQASIHDTLHPMGGTRMSHEPGQGVVDASLRVHGTSNLYLASCSVFPTGGSSNPTLTLMALCLRLADHLRSAS